MRGLFDALFGRGCTTHCHTHYYKCCNGGIATLPVYGEIVDEISVSHYMNVPMNIVKLGPSVGTCVAGAATGCNCCCNCGCGGGCGGCGGCGNWWGRC